MGRLAALALTFWMLFPLGAAAEAGARVALVVGNGSYDQSARRSRWMPSSRRRRTGSRSGKAGRSLSNRGSLRVTPQAPSAAHLSGRAKVSLGLNRQPQGWRIVSETSEALN